jgi:DNA-binding NarL/FixJ family response regulator
MTTRLLICDDHPLFRTGLRTALSGEADVEIVGEACNGSECLTMLEALAPDVVLLDLALPGIDGYEVLRWAHERMPGLRSIVLSMYSEWPFAARARSLGAAGFIAKEDALSEIRAALRHAPETFYASASVRPARGGRFVGAGVAIEDRLQALSPTERRVMGLLSQSLTSREIAGQLGISFRTVQTHRAHIAEKLGLHGVNRLMELAIRYRKLFP